MKNKRSILDHFAVKIKILLILFSLFSSMLINREKTMGLGIRTFTPSVCYPNNVFLNIYNSLIMAYK